MSIVLSATSFALVIGTWAAYLSSIPRGKVPVSPVGTLLAQTVGAIGAVTAIVLGFQAGGAPGPLGFALSGVALIMGLLFVFLYSQRKVPASDLQVAMGDKLIAFEAIDSSGAPFSSASLKGKRVLLKFFRGGW